MKNLPIERYFLIIAAVYLTIGMTAGIAMGISEDFTYRHVHSHINLIGWVCMAIFGIVYKIYPNAAKSKIALPHFIVANLGAIIFLPGIFLAISTNHEIIIGAVIGSLLTLTSIIMFLINIILNAK